MTIGPKLLASLLLASVAASVAFADPTPPADVAAPAEIGPFSVRPLVGAFIPSGAQRRDLSRSVVTGSELAWALPMPLRLVGSFTWTPSRERAFSDARASILQYDAGAELAPRRSVGTGWTASPFFGLGLGARTYRPRNSIPGQTDFDGYASLGGELDRSALGLRAEVRDYVSRFKTLPAETSTSTRNDLMLTGALTIHL